MPQPLGPGSDAASDDEAEDAADIRASEEARAEMRETGAEPIPWEQVKAELGLC
jgi:hypothetical protein